jgi:dolichol kinase
LNKNDLLNFQAELKRKSIHLLCSLLPFLYYYYLIREQIILISSTISILFLIAEFLRFRNKLSKDLFRRIFDPLLREEEKNNHITGATYLFISATVTFIIFEKNTAVVAVLILTIADSFAAIVGKMTDSGRFFSKSLAGSTTFFLISLFIIALFFPAIGLVSVIIAVLITILEALPLRINDNLLISLGTGFLLYLVV